MICAIPINSMFLTFNFQTGTVILGCLGIILFVLALVPHTIILQNHDFYINHFVMHQRSEGIRDLRDTEIPEIEHFSKIASGILVAYDTVFIFSSIFLIAGMKNIYSFFQIHILILILISYPDINIRHVTLFQEFRQKSDFC